MHLDTDSFKTRMKKGRPVSGIPSACGPTVDQTFVDFYVKFFNGPFPDPFLFIFSLTQTNITIFTTNKNKKCPSSLRCWNSN